MREVFSRRPSPPHSLQGFSTIWPVPRQRGQVWETWKKPREEMTWPRPPQVGQLDAREPGSAPLPAQRPHPSSLVISISFSQPAAASSRRIWRSYRRSLPRWRASRLLPPARRRRRIARRCRRPPPPRAAEDLAEEIEGIVEAAGAGGALREGGVAEAVVGGPLLIVHEDVVGFAKLLEVLLGVRVAGVLVGVKFHRETPVRFLDLLGRGGPGDLEDFVIIAFGRGHGRWLCGKVNQERSIRRAECTQNQGWRDRSNHVSKGTGNALLFPAV